MLKATVLINARVICRKINPRYRTFSPHSATFAFVRLLSRVSSNVDGQTRGIFEQHAAKTAQMRLFNPFSSGCLGCVSEFFVFPHVLSQRTRLGERRQTQRASVGFLAGVQRHVPAHVERPRKALVADLRRRGKLAHTTVVAFSVCVPCR